MKRRNSVTYVTYGENHETAFSKLKLNTNSFKSNEVLKRFETKRSSS